jgi:two-component system, OmpR family, alkaline phosphatase synthesis response regulator PhoP
MKAISPTKSKSDTFRWVRNLFGPPIKPQITDSKAMVMPLSKLTPAAKRRDKAVLVVDDDPLFLKVTSARLQADGYDVFTAEDGSEAIQSVRRRKPSLVVLDVNLPQDVTGVPWDGMRLIAWMKRFEDLKDIPVVMVTAGDPTKYTRLAVGAGAIGFFHKRMDPAHLLTMVSHTLTRKCHPPTTESVDTNFQI